MPSTILLKESLGENLFEVNSIDAMMAEGKAKLYVVSMAVMQRSLEYQAPH